MKQKSHFDLMNEAREQGKHPISFSQMSKYNTCQLSYKLKYIDKIKVPDDTNINLLFGDAMHQTVQFWLKHLYQNERMANNLDLSNILYKYMADLYSKLKNKDIVPKETFKEYLNDGIGILNFLKANYKDYFDPKKTKLISIEEDVNETIGTTNLNMIGFIDIKLQDIETGDVLVIDLKTSKSNWNSYKEKDINTIGQLLLYNTLLSKKYNLPIEKFKPIFIILKRKVFGDKGKHIQIVKPAHGTGKYNELNKYVTEFTSTVFHEDTSYNVDREYKKAEKNFACTFCPYKGSKYCDMHKLDETHVLNK